MQINLKSKNGLFCYSHSRKHSSFRTMTDQRAGDVLSKQPQKDVISVQYRTDLKGCLSAPFLSKGAWGLSLPSPVPAFFMSKTLIHISNFILDHRP